MAHAAAEKSALTRRQEFEAMRRARMDRPKEFHYGVDTDAIAQQIADKKRAKEEEAKLDADFDDLRLKMDKHLMYVDQQRDAHLRARNREVDEFRKSSQTMESRREFDLNDPALLKKQAPARAGDDDSNLSVSGIQQLSGEDLDISERVRLQQQQLRAWNEKVSRERAAKIESDQHDDDVWANHLLEADIKRCEYAEKEAEEYRQRQMEVARFNQSQAQLKDELRKEAERQEKLDNFVDIQGHLNSAWLNEDPSLTRSFVQPHRYAGRVHTPVPCEPAPRGHTPDPTTGRARITLRASPKPSARPSSMRVPNRWMTTRRCKPPRRRLRTILRSSHCSGIMWPWSRKMR